MKDAVDAKAHDRVGGAGLDVDVTRALLERVVEQEVHGPNDVLVGHLGQLFVRAQLDELHQRCLTRALAQLDLRARDALAEAVDALDDRENVALGGDAIAKRGLYELLQALTQRAVEGIGEREL